MLGIIMKIDCEIGVWFSVGAEVFRFSTATRLGLRATQPSIRRGPWTHFPAENWPELETDLSTPSGAKVKNSWRYTFTLQYIFMAWCLIN
jgi:hypothetical protein